MTMHSQMGNSAYVRYWFALPNDMYIDDNTTELVSPYPDDYFTVEYRAKINGVWGDWVKPVTDSDSGVGISTVYTDGVTAVGTGMASDPIASRVPRFDTMPDYSSFPDGFAFAVRSTGNVGGDGLPQPGGGVQQYTYVYRMDEVKLHPEGPDNFFNMITVDAPWAIPIIAANEAAGRPMYAGIKISMQVPGNLDPQMQVKLSLNQNINEPLSDDWFMYWPTVFSHLGGYEASYLRPEGIYNFTFNDSVNSWAQVWRIDHDGMYNV